MPPDEVKCLLCFDFDGTLVDPESDPTFNAEFFDVMAELRGLGAAWAIATGRTLYSTLEGLTRHGLREAPDFIIAREQDIFYPGQFNRWQDFGGWNAQSRKDHQRFAKAHRKPLQRLREVAEGFGAQWTVEGDGLDIGIIARSTGDMDAICEAVEAERAAFPALGYNRNTIYLRFNDARYHKGAAVAELARLLGVAPAFTLAMGDNHNDLSMLDGRAAHGTACPGNALPEVKDAVRQSGGYVARGIASCGVIEALRYFFWERG